MSDVKENLKDTGIWLRGLFMLLFAIFFSVARIVLTVVVIVQFLIRLFSGALNDRLLRFGRSLSSYIYEIMLFLTFATEQKPFPWADWPSSAAPETAASAEHPAGPAAPPAPPAPPAATIPDEKALQVSEGEAPTPAPEASGEPPAATGEQTQSSGTQEAGGETQPPEDERSPVNPR